MLSLYWYQLRTPRPNRPVRNTVNMNTKRISTIVTAIIIFTLSYSVATTQHALNVQYAAASQPKPTVKKSKPVEKPNESKNDTNTARVTPEPVKTEPTPVSTPKPAETTQNVANTGGCEQWRPLVSQYDWDVRTAMAVMQQESTMNGIPCNNMAINPTDDHTSWAGCMGSFGLFQINCSHGAVYDPAKNVAIAYDMWKRSGWQPWTSYTSGEYAKYLR